MAVSPLTLTAPGGLLLERLPDRLFGPLASANRHRYWALLCLLHQRRFGPDAPMPPVHGFPVREIVHNIEEDLAAQDAWDDEGGESAAETPLGVRAIGVFNRLRDAGWFRVDRHGLREMVTMRPAVAQFMDRLVEFAQTGPVLVSGKVRSIDLNLQAWQMHPSDVPVEHRRPAKPSTISRMQYFAREAGWDEYADAIGAAGFTVEQEALDHSA